MSTLEGKTIAGTYKDLLQISNNNEGVDTVIRAIEDGEGTPSALSLSTTTAQFGGLLLPGVDATHDIGTSGQAFKDLYLSGSVYLQGVDFTSSDLSVVKDLVAGQYATVTQGDKADTALQPGGVSCPSD